MPLHDLASHHNTYFPNTQTSKQTMQLHRSINGCTILLLDIVTNLSGAYGYNRQCNNVLVLQYQVARMPGMYSKDCSLYIVMASYCMDRFIQIPK